MTKLLSDGKINEAGIISDNEWASFTYDALSRITTAANSTGTVTYSYDNRGRVSSVEDVWGRYIEYEYDWAIKHPSAYTPTARKLIRCMK